MEPVGCERSISGMKYYPYDVPLDGVWDDPWNEGKMRRAVGHPATGRLTRMMPSHTIFHGIPCFPGSLPQDDPWDELPPRIHRTGRPMDRYMACSMA